MRTVRVQVTVEVDLEQCGRAVRGPVSAGCAPLNPSPFRSSASTKASTARTGLSSAIQSSSCSGNSTLCDRSCPSMNRLISDPVNALCHMSKRDADSFRTASTQSGRSHFEPSAKRVLGDLAEHVAPLVDTIPGHVNITPPLQGIAHRCAAAALLSKGHQRPVNVVR